MTPHEIWAWRNSPDAKANDPKWKIRVIPNQFPVLKVEGLLDPRADGLYDKMNGIGANEVLVESPEHDQDLDTLPLDHVEQILWTIRERFLDLRKDIRIQYVQAFKNYGELAGAALAHPHIQMIGLPITPKSIREELEGFKRHWNARGRCVYCDIVRQDTRNPERLVMENEHFIVLTPFASRFPFETWILPKQHLADYACLTKPEAKALARILQDILIRIRKVLRDPAYNLVLHTLPFQSPNNQEFHWHLEIFPRLSRVTGFEWSTDFFVNPTAPEEAALFLREAIA